MTYTQDLQATIEAIGREYPRIAAWFRAFSGADWARPTFCPGWSAAKAAGHLAFGAEFFAEAITNGLKGYVGLPYGAGSWEEFMRIRDAKAEEIGRLSGAALVDRFESNMAAVVKLFRSLAPEDYERPAWHRRAVFPIRRFIFSRLNELLLHEWDIRNQPGAPLAQDAVPVAAWNRPGDHGADAAFSASAGDMLLLTSGRADVERCKREGRFRVEGDAAKASALMPKLFFPL
ncbi:MAG: maleylpyruvate isomerase family mycothiol-dependent enzyme [Candidatus Tectomicrobia bacterium]|nr:maleylpyruvate isomerase family mycothiol-dependent enzyme [Candidatus Tectomicrobia bacterium]